MKNILAIIILALVAVPAMAKDVGYKQCEATHYSGSNYYTYSTNITFDTSGETTASTNIMRTSQRSNTSDGVGGYESSVEIKNFKVRADLASGPEQATLNLGEKIITSAMKADLKAEVCRNSKDCEDDINSSGLDLKLVRSLTVYILTDREDHSKKPSIVEVFSASGKSMGMLEVDTANDLVSNCRN